MLLEIEDKTYAWFKEAIAHMHDMYTNENFEYGEDDARDIADMLESCIDKNEQGDGPKLKVPCAFGTLVGEVAGDPGIYDEIEIDLVRPDGMLMQLCVAGTGPDPRGEQDEMDLHVYVWDGSDECPTTTVYPDMSTEHWY